MKLMAFTFAGRIAAALPTVRRLDPLGKLPRLPARQYCSREAHSDASVISCKRSSIMLGGRAHGSGSGSGSLAFGLHPTAHLQVGSRFPFSYVSDAYFVSIGIIGSAIMRPGMPIESGVPCGPVSCMLRVWLIFMVPGRLSWADKGSVEVVSRM